MHDIFGYTGMHVARAIAIYDISNVFIGSKGLNSQGFSVDTTTSLSYALHVYGCSNYKLYKLPFHAFSAVYQVAI